MNAEGISYSKLIKCFVLSKESDYVFGLADLAHLASYDAIRQTLKRMAEDEQIRRLFIGIYWFNLSRRKHPSADEVLDAVARNNRWVTAPGTELARYTLGLNGEKPPVPTYLSTGPTSKYTYCETQHLVLQRCTGKYLVFANPATTLLVSALLDQKVHPITPEEMVYLSGKLSPEEKATILEDRAYIPARLRPIIEVICR